MDPADRIIDASTNRAAEGLRVLEDLARFALDDAVLCAQLKDIRHGLRARSASLIGVVGLGSRDTPGDVGTAISTPSESDRPGLASVASAAAGRCCEALRSIEECAKALGKPDPWFEQTRYAIYDIERTIVVRLSARAPQWRLCVILSTDLCAQRSPEQVARAAIEGGADCLQIREKTMDSRPLLELARRIVAIAHTKSVAVIINDRPDIAKLAGADGVHVGQSDLCVADARRIAGPGAIVGVSTSTMDQARRAVADGASMCGVGAMFETTTKEKNTIAGPGLLEKFFANPATRGTPHLAIGGITPANIARLAAVGCRGVAVSSAVCGAEDPTKVCQALCAALPGPA